MGMRERLRHWLEGQEPQDPRAEGPKKVDSIAKLLALFGGFKELPPKHQELLINYAHSYYRYMSHEFGMPPNYLVSERPNVADPAPNGPYEEKFRATTEILTDMLQQENHLLELGIPQIFVRAAQLISVGIFQEQERRSKLKEQLKLKEYHPIQEYHPTISSETQIEERLNRQAALHQLDINNLKRIINANTQTVSGVRSGSRELWWR